MTVFYELMRLIAALREGQIPFTIALQRICNDEAIREATADQMREPHIFDEGMPEWLTRLFKEEGLSEEEISHAGSWPAEQKEALRAAISFAYDARQPLTFGWDITRDESPQMDIQQIEGGGSHIVFMSPRAALEGARSGGAH